MFMNIMHFPPVKPGMDEEFRQWFKWSNAQYASQPGFISRRLLKSRSVDEYKVIIEHESFETFLAMHKSPEQAAAHKRLEPLLEGGPTADFYELIDEA